MVPPRLVSITTTGIVGRLPGKWVRILDEGGMHVELDEGSLDESLDQAEAWAKDFMSQHYAKEVKEMLGKKG